MLLGLGLAGCQREEASQPQTTVFRLFDLYRPEDLAGKVTPEDAGWKRTEWRAADMARWEPPASSGTDATPPPAANMAAIRFRALNDAGELRVEQGQLAGVSKGPAPVLHFALKDNRGGAASVKFIEMRMNVSGAKQLWLRTEGGPSIDEEAMVRWASQSEPWNGTNDVVEGKLQTYRFEIRSTRGPRGGSRGDPRPPGGGAPPGPPRPGDMNGPTGGGAPNPPGGPPMDPPPRGPGGRGGGDRGGGPPPGDGGSSRGSTGDLRHVLIAFRDAESAKFAIESIRFVTDKEEKLAEPSGQQWAGLAEIYRATLAAKTPESIRIPLRALPERAWLDFAYGTAEDEPVRFQVALAPREAARDAAPTVLFERTVTIPNRWQTAKIDLSRYAGQSVVLHFSLAGGQKGLWGYWGNPVVRTRLSVSSGASAPATAATGPIRPRGVIFLVIDTLRKDHLNIYGYHRETLVHLKKFAEEGVAFRHAISQGTMTKISVPSMVTSLYPLTHTVLGFDKGLPASATTIAEVFRDAGYATVAYSSVPFTGKANNMHQGYDELHEAGSISDNEYRSKTARHYVDRLITWLRENQDVPFFAFLHVFDPHSPFRPRPPYDTLWGAPGSKDRLAELEAEMRQKKIRTGMDSLPNKEEYLKTGNSPDELLKIYIDWYDGSIRGVDAEIGRLLEALREMGLDRDTLMVWGTDHGEEFWEHGKLFHGHSVYGELNQVPLVFRWPNSPDIRKGVMVDALVENIDIMPTILSLAGLTGPTNMQGRSLVPLLNGSGIATWQERPAFTHAMVRDDPPPGAPQDGPGRNTPERAHLGVIDRGWKLVRKETEPEATEELFEHPADPLDLTNVITAATAPAHVKALNETLVGWKTRAHAAQLPNDDTMTQQLSSEELRRLRALGYVGGGTPPPPRTNAP
ncbi:MAG TPA: sulfatase, partial [Methylomirabilota bacterium]|nr:sulfatase [Methylomirabilota bacterium]